MRKAAIAASAAILLFGPTAAVASAQPDAEPGLPAELITAVSRDLKISADEYLRRADLAQQVAAFATTAQRQFPQVFGGAWLDDAGKAVVALAPGSGLDEART
ncbi:protease, partial [Nocardia cyriacigeorgica]|nr:protease [Nocardia cyriacigeorgica]